MQSTNSFFPVAEIHLSYKNKPDLSQRPIITKSSDAYKVFLDSWDENKLGFVEQTKVLLLNKCNRVLGIYEHSTGGIDSTICDPRLIFVAALKANASSIILAHNHPSQNTQPSHADKQLTTQIKDGGKKLQIEMLDHLIITPIGYYSFTDDATYKNENSNQDRSSGQHKLPNSERETMSSSLQRKSLIDENILGTLPNIPIKKAEAAYELLIASWEANRLDLVHNFKLLLLDEKCKPISSLSLPLQSSLATPTDAQQLIALAAKENAHHFILAQNKPYGVILPNTTDLEFTESLANEGNEHDITLLHYLFVNQNGYYSYYNNEFHLSDKPKIT